jgi:ATP-dependent RNA helicase DeaD
MVWFRMNVGRRNNADPRWLVPIICRLGHVTKNDIGVFRIADRETKFEIAEPLAGRFAASVRRSTNDEDIRIEPAGAGGPMPPARAEGKPAKHRPNGGPGGGGKPPGAPRGPRPPGAQKPDKKKKRRPAPRAD